jgi:hypothetical protein
MNKFREDFELWEWQLRHLEKQPEESIAEIKETIRAAWENPELRELWIAHVKEKADQTRELWAMSKGITNRMKQKRKEK